MRIMVLLAVMAATAQAQDVWLTRSQVSKLVQSTMRVEIQHPFDPTHPLLTIDHSLGSISGNNPVILYSTSGTGPSYSSPGTSTATTSVDAHDDEGNIGGGYSQWITWAQDEVDDEITLGHETGMCVILHTQHLIFNPLLTRKVNVGATGWGQVRDHWQVHVADEGSALVHFQSVFTMDYPFTPTSLPLYCKFGDNNELTAEYLVVGLQGWWKVEGFLQHPGGGNTIPFLQFYTDLVGSDAVTETYDFYEIAQDQQHVEVQSKIGVQEWQEAGMQAQEESPGVGPWTGGETSFHDARLVYMGSTDL